MSWDATDCSTLGSFLNGILYTKILDCIVFLYLSRRPSQPRDQTQVSCIAGKFFISWTIREAQEKLEWRDYPFSSGSSWPRNGTGVSCIADRCFTNWTIRVALYHSEPDGNHFYLFYKACVQPGYSSAQNYL